MHNNCLDDDILIHLLPRLEKAAYRQHEVIKLVVDVNNHSSAEVTGVTVTVRIVTNTLYVFVCVCVCCVIGVDCNVYVLLQLKRVLKLLGMDRSQQEEELIDQTSVDTILSTTHSGCPGHSFKSM